MENNLKDFIEHINQYKIKEKDKKQLIKLYKEIQKKKQKEIE